MAEIAIRRAGPGDAERLSLAAQATFLESFSDILPGTDILLHCRRQHSAAAFETHLADGQSTAWLAEARRGAPIGYALLTSPELPTIEGAPGDIELKRIYVLSRFHGTGTGRMLMDAVTAEARARGRARLLLGVYGRNGRAIRFYQKSGFSLIGTRRFRVGENDYDDVIMARALQQPPSAAAASRT